MKLNKDECSATIFTGKKPRDSYNRILGWPQCLSERAGEEQSPYTSR